MLLKYHCHLVVNVISSSISVGCIVLTVILPPTVPWGAFPYDEREHEPASSVVVYRSDHHPHHHRNLANETSQELLWGQKAGVKIRQNYRDNNLTLVCCWMNNIHCRYGFQAWKYSFFFFFDSVLYLEQINSDKMIINRQNINNA